MSVSPRGGWGGGAAGEMDFVPFEIQRHMGRVRATGSLAREGSVHAFDREGGVGTEAWRLTFRREGSRGWDEEAGADGSRGTAARRGGKEREEAYSYVEEARRGGRRVYMEDGPLCAAERRPELYGGSALLAGPLSARQQAAPALGGYSDLTDSRLPDGRPGLPSWDPAPGLHRPRGLGSITNGALLQSAYLRAGAGATAGTAANPVDGFLLPVKGRRGKGRRASEVAAHERRRTVLELAKLGLDADAMRGAGTMAHAFLGGGSLAHTLRTNKEAADSLKARVGIRDNLDHLSRANSAMSLEREGEEARGLVSRGSQYGSLASRSGSSPPLSRSVSRLGDHVYGEWVRPHSPGSGRSSRHSLNSSGRGPLRSEDGGGGGGGEGPQLEELSPRDERSSGVHAASPRVRSGENFYASAEEAEASTHATQWAPRDAKLMRRVSADGSEDPGEVARGAERARARSRSPEGSRPRDGPSAVALAAVTVGRRPSREQSASTVPVGIYVDDSIVMQESDAASMVFQGTLPNGQSFVSSAGLVGRDLMESNRASLLASGLAASRPGNVHARKEAKMGGGFKVGIPRTTVTRKTAPLCGVVKPISGPKRPPP